MPRPATSRAPANDVRVVHHEEEVMGTIVTIDLFSRRPMLGDGTGPGPGLRPPP